MGRLDVPGMARPVCRESRRVNDSGAPAFRMSKQPAVTNILSIDLEDWHQLVHRRLKGATGPPSRNVDRQLDALLALFDEHRVKATFFALGMLAETRPD